MLISHHLRRPARLGRLTGTALACTALLATGCTVYGGSNGTGTGEFPNRPVEFTVPTEPGGSSDLVTRALARSTEEHLDGTTIVVNKPGANGKVAGNSVFRSEPDGHRVAVMPQSLFSIGPLVVDDPEPIELSDMTFIKGLTIEDYVLVVPAGSPHRDLDDLLGQDRLNYGTAGAGTGGQLAQALLFGFTDVPAADIPFDGGGPTMTAVLGGQVDVAALHPAEVMPQIEAGGLRPIIVFSDERLDALPDTPTAVESGYDVVVDQRRFLAAPAGLPDKLVDRLGAAADKATVDNEYETILENNYIRQWNAESAEVESQLSESRQRYATLSRELGVDLGGQS
ncbi:tripartite-type tricarboxylate transporter receptor subunit TctC [Tamaricihabitans halophyticus]|uniref:Tripartite-type tricarboxylate transporter receptor subunit TctC n=1 Tax=Tamaricihabitans halophyticus TaxID=1262583 RepID=A0A4R2QN23_9PSEU|nr:tripartite tricarboxylate transporter substrate binding protein [Tamaricihabitans halophyticus]TCP49988.1 tripartite-type tricarboxylate transporter receptor subunit TctC [Tamaricihabitans halophyticus]